MNRKDTLRYQLDLMEQNMSEMKRFVDEAYIFDDANPAQGAQPSPASAAPQQQPAKLGQEPAPAEEEPQGNDQSFDRVAKIRKVAIEGIQEYADDVNNPLYNFYKKVFNEADKVMSDKAHSLDANSAPQQ